MKKVITHSGKFHADEVFALATLALCFGDKNLDIFRTRDSAFFDEADFIVDVGGKFDGEKFFDHHQKGGAGERKNTVPYASFGLIWRKFGNDICSSLEVFDLVDKELVQFVDLVDSGIGEIKPIFEDIKPFNISDAVTFFNMERTSKDDEDFLVFKKALDFAILVLKNVISFYEKFVSDKKEIERIYKNSPDKRVLIFEDNYQWEMVLKDYKDVLYVIEPDDKKLPNFKWRLGAVRDNPASFLNRKDLPKEWGGLRDEELSEVSGIPGSIFCHNMLFMAINKTKEGALKMAQKALLG